jgi:hypothetical protein
MNFWAIINKSFGVYNIKGIQIEPTLWEVAAIVFLLFLLVLTLARLRYLYVNWHFSRQSFSFLFYGFLLAMILEGFLILSGRTLFTTVIGWKNPPKPISTALDAGRTKLVQVLGVQESIPDSVASELPTAQSIITGFQSLSSDERQEVQLYICKP